MNKSVLLVIVLLAALVLPLQACTNMSRTQQGAVSGGLLGAGAGAGISALAGGGVGVGAAIGGALGGVVGGLYGYDQENNDDRSYRDRNRGRKR